MLDAEGQPGNNYSMVGMVLVVIFSVCAKLWCSYGGSGQKRDREKELCTGTKFGLRLFV